MENVSTNSLNSIYNAAIRSNEAKLKFVSLLKVLTDMTIEDLMKPEMESQLEKLITQGNTYAMIREEFAEEVFNAQKVQPPITNVISNLAPVVAPVVAPKVQERPTTNLTRFSIKPNKQRSIQEIFSGRSMPSANFVKLLDAIKLHHDELKTEFTASKFKELINSNEENQAMSSKIYRLHECGIIDKVRSIRNTGYWVVSDIALLRIDEIKTFLANKEKQLASKRPVKLF